MPNTPLTHLRPEAGRGTSDELLVSQPDNGEQALEIADMLVRSGGVDVVVIDSVAALTPKAEIEGEMGELPHGPAGPPDVPGAAQAHRQHQALQHLVIFINQIRMKIGVMFGSPETTTGGNALKFYASVRMDIRRIGTIKNGDEVIGSETRVKVVKNKVAPPFREAPVRHPVWRRHLPRRRDHRSGRDPGIIQTSPAPGMPTRARRSVRARTTPASS
jgi:protein RecA